MRFALTGLAWAGAAALLSGLQLFPATAAATTASAGATPVQERRLPLAGTVNTRDLGGYRTAGGQRVKWGLLYRSDGLSGLDEPDRQLLGQLGLATITDFRSEQERAAAPDSLPRQNPPPEYQVVAVNNPVVDVKELGRKVFAGELTNAELEALLDRRAYVNDPALRRAWGGWLRSLADPGALPQLFHCTAGKDRTGFAAAIVLLALGIPRETVMEDFLLSNHYLQANIDQGVRQIQDNARTQLDEQLLRQVVGVGAQSLQQAFDEMEAQFGSIDNYLSAGLGLDEATRARLRESLLE